MMADHDAWVEATFVAITAHLREPDLGRFGRFELLKVLGQGGMAVVYCAIDMDTGEVVALKRARGGDLAPELRERIRREARHAQRVEHRHIVKVLESSEHDGE